MKSEPCSAWNKEKGFCVNGFVRKTSVCWGGSLGCPTCGNISKESLPDCMKEDLPKHLIPVKWREE